MIDLDAPVSLIWCGPMSSTSDGPAHWPGFQLLPCAPESLVTAVADVALIEACAFSSLEALRGACADVLMPALIRVSPAKLSQVLAVLRPGDDVCLEDEPVALILHRLRRLALLPQRDGLTHLYTHRVLVRQLEADLLVAEEVRPVSILAIDLDHFKRLNNDHGHLAGDVGVFSRRSASRQTWTWSLASSTAAT